MESRGRGIRSAKQQADEPPPVVSTAWADFMMEEGVENTVVTDKQEEKEESTATATDSTTLNSERIHVLPLVPSWEEEDQPKKKSKSNGGILVQTGTLDSTTIGRSKRPMDQTYDLMIPSIILPSVQIKRVICGSNAAHAICLSLDGQAYGWGRNEASQLGLPSSNIIKLPTLLNIETVIVDGAVGKSHTILLDDSHQLWAVGNNKYGQCSIRNFTETVPNFRKCVVPKDVNMVQVSII